MTKTKILCISGITIAAYVTIMYITQSFAFGLYQIRIATAFYSLSYFFPFLILPLGLGNLISNFLFGGLGITDIIGGTIVGILTSGAVFLIRKFKLPAIFVIPAIVLIPGALVPVWLSVLLNLPYNLLLISICVGQSLPAILGFMLIKILSRLGVKELWVKDKL